MILNVESISKKYTISHENKVSYLTLREQIMDKLKGGSAKIQTEEFWALQDVSFSINQGDRLGIIGRNGAGKSTLLKILSRITPPTKGRITMHGTVASLLEVGTGFHPELTGRENIYLNGALLGMTKAEIAKKFDAIVDFSGVAQFLDTPVKRYSSGMYVRLAFAVAAHLEPDILIIDEVLAVGDGTFQKKCLGKINDISKDGKTIIFVTHNMSLLNFCNKGLLLDKGKVIETTDLQDCIQKYHGEISGKAQRWLGNSGDSNVRIYEFKVSPSLIQRGVKGTIDITYEVLKPLDNLVVGYFIYNKNGHEILHYKISKDDFIPLKASPGRYRVKTEIDFGLFSEGTYRIDLDIGIHNISRISTSDIHIYFDVLNNKRKYGEPTNTILPNWNYTIEAEAPV